MAPAPNYARRRMFALVLVATVVIGGLALVSSAVGNGGTEPATTTTSSTTSAPSTTTLTTPPECTFGDVVTEQVAVEEWNRSIIDTERRLPAGYEPTDLVPVTAAGFDGDFAVRSFLLDDLDALRRAADRNGTPIELIAGYRSIEDQQALFDRREAEMGFDRAAARTARQGHSEHHLGTTVDFKTAGAEDVFQSWASEPAGQFVLANAHRYGFIVSYPDGADDRSCYDFEPWHYRYFGVDLAARIHASGMTAREYLWHWQETGTEPS